MRFPAEIKKCVVFIGLQMADASFKIVGTGFLVYDDLSSNKLPFIVTAKHVINGIHGKGLNEVFIRFNLTDGTSKWYTSKFADWKLNSDENVDVGVYQAAGDPLWDHTHYLLSTSLSHELISKNEVDVGDEVFVIGLFNHHHGQRRNIPIVRIGNISAMDEEKIQTSQHLMDAYLIEARSIGGLSGSPVFINLGEVRYLNVSLRHSANGQEIILMGLIYGHYDVKSNSIDEVETDSTSATKVQNVNTGIAIVTPIAKVIETIKQ